jgi:hypothetical protein
MKRVLTAGSGTTLIVAGRVASTAIGSAKASPRSALETAMALSPCATPRKVSETSANASGWSASRRAGASKETWVRLLWNDRDFA